ncbi:AAA family ATPase [Burkholderia sp. Bp9090]|uniref:AAA family ATPase n=1 Tax=unclassified Burkholderia TaxID=2613784 RepID=UPI000F58CF85|nr:MULTISPECIES: AAA family ATPase [unclassified Burkholderia]RQR72348.1 AAA family ATPase [Burkholderia sp. Bp9011]RQR95680.1 AAA family ATPase [Burkholderia sp. Bp8991]RQR99047.1 AAA family ATPase [Burkholderia sp. Bp9010]RQS65588.1 AAA family ATPase [Burkholderia sp. Bp8977]RQZ40588.1 AAA family ATPase [Burkholderia sp. Bp9090]
MRICIVGPSGAGKTTIAGELARKFNIATYEFDNVYWDTSGTEFVKNSDETMAKAIEKILKQGCWFVEGAYDKRMYPLLAECSLILRVEVSFSVRAMRLIKRFVWSTVTGKLPKETFRNTVDLIKFSFHFDKRLSEFLSADVMLSRKVASVRDTSSCIEAMRAAGLC